MQNFDIVDHAILLKKLELNGFEKNSLDWIQSYLTGRSQCVSINGSLSKLLPVPIGVPQGSILGPVFYTLFTNELPEVVHNHDQDDHHAGTVSWPPYNFSCKFFGNICSSTNSALLSEKLSDKFLEISDFLVFYRLKLNDDETIYLLLPAVRLGKPGKKLVGA